MNLSVLLDYIRSLFDFLGLLDRNIVCKMSLCCFASANRVQSRNLNELLLLIPEYSGPRVLVLFLDYSLVYVSTFPLADLKLQFLPKFLAIEPLIWRTLGFWSHFARQN